MGGALLRDNPVLVKHLRARLRLHRAIPWVAIVVILSALITYSAHTGGGPKEVFGLMLALQAIILQLLGSAQVMASVSRARESGMLDFHRMSPQSAASVTLGFLLGAPILEYVLLACTVPFSLAITIGYLGFSKWLVIFADLLIAALLYHAAAVLAGLVLPKTASSPVLVIGVLIVLLPFLRPLTSLRPLLYLTLIPTVTAATAALSAGSPATAPLARTLPVFLTSLLHQIPVLLVFLLAASRKMQHEGTAPLSKLGAIIAFALVAALSLVDASAPPELLERGPFGEAGSVSAMPILCYTLFLLGLLLCAAVTPGANAFARGIRQARRLGRARPSRWSDRAPNWVAVGGLVAITLLAGAAGTRMIPAPVSLVRSGLWATATAACALAFFALAYQAFGLWFRKHSAVYLTLLLFLVWGVPLLLGAILAASNSSPSAEPPLILAVSPLAGIAAAFAHGPWRDALPAAETAFIASAFLAVCFAGLCWAAVRRAAKTAQARS